MFKGMSKLVMLSNFWFWKEPLVSIIYLCWFGKTSTIVFLNGFLDLYNFQLWKFPKKFGVWSNFRLVLIPFTILHPWPNYKLLSSSPTNIFCINNYVLLIKTKSYLKIELNWVFLKFKKKRCYIMARNNAMASRRNGNPLFIQIKEKLWQKWK